MDTELKIVYSIIETVKKQNNDDSKLSERFIRTCVQDYRAAMISEYFEKGMTVSEECFQTLYGQIFTGSLREYTATNIPKIIRTKDNFGIILEKNGYTIPVVNSQDYQFSKNHFISKYMPRAKFLGSNMTLYIGMKRQDCHENELLDDIIEAFEAEAAEAGKPKVKADLHAIFSDPDSVPGYDWTKSPFPFPSELVPDLRSEILRKEFNIILQVKEDKVTDGEEEART